MLGLSKTALVGIPLLALGALAAGVEAKLTPAANRDAPLALGDEDGYEQEFDLREVAATAQLGLSHAIVLALLATPGHAVEAEFEVEGKGAEKQIFFEITIVGADKQLHELKLSTENGAVLEQSVENDADDLRELKAYAEVLRHTERTLASLVDGASALVKGQAVYAGLEFDDDGPECEVLVVNGRYLVEVELEARAGHIVELELVGMQDDDDDEHASDDDDDDEQEGRDDDDDDDGDDD